MAVSKRIPKCKISPTARSVVIDKNPDSYFREHPSWRFNFCDTQKWTFDESHAGKYFWNGIFPRLKYFESMTWNEILLDNKKSNHSIDINYLNNSAIKRLGEMNIEAESILSLRIQGTHRIYGYMDGSVFCILWFDDDHGDNNLCVCRSRKKHT